MDNAENNKLFELYTLAEIAYQKKFKNTIDDESYLYPEGWYENKNYKLKIEIITEAIKNNTLIEKTPKYLKIVEGVGNVLVKEQKNQ